jgi:cytochrome P450 family 135
MAEHTPAADQLPPGPRLPRTLQTALWGLQPIGFMERCRRRYGDMFTIRTLGLGDIVVVADPDTIGEVFRADRDVFRAGEANAALGPVVGEHSLLLLDGERHLRERRMMLPPFHGEAVRAYGERIEQLAETEIARWPVGVPFALRERLRAITLEVILHAVIGVRDHARLARLRQLLPQLLDFSVLDMWAVWLYPKLLETPIGRRHRSRRIRPEVDRLLFAEIAEHRAAPDGRDDVLAMLVAARDDHGEALSDLALRDQLITLLLAGHETTTTALAWCFERLVRHPRALARLQRELDAGEGEAYLDAVINETLRVRPVIDSVWRTLAAPAELGGYRLPAGVRVMPSIVLVQRSPSYGDVDEFRPERFLGTAPPAYSLIPFGGGPRRCIGASFAVMEMKTILRTILTAFDVRTPDRKPEAVRLHHITLVPARGARVILTPRPRPVSAASHPEARVPSYS